FEGWERYNPDARPAVAYWPDGACSVWGTEQFVERGVPWAHVDANDAIIPEIRRIDGVKTIITRRVKLNRGIWLEILERFRAGEIKGLSSRFKLREGVDVPQIYHAILATPI